MSRHGSYFQTARSWSTKCFWIMARQENGYVAKWHDPEFGRALSIQFPHHAELSSATHSSYSCSRVLLRVLSEAGKRDAEQTVFENRVQNCLASAEREHWILLRLHLQRASHWSQVPFKGCAVLGLPHRHIGKEKSSATYAPCH